MRASECLRHSLAHDQARAAFENEALDYRRNLEALKRFLPDLHVRLLAEKSRLETARTHVAAAAAWAQAGKSFERSAPHCNPADHLLLPPDCGIMNAMSATTSKVLQAVFWFVLGHISCAIMHHMHHLSR